MRIWWMGVSIALLSWLSLSTSRDEEFDNIFTGLSGVAGAALFLGKMQETDP